jgi:hypothetical protein
MNAAKAMMSPAARPAIAHAHPGTACLLADLGMGFTDMAPEISEGVTGRVTEMARVIFQAGNENVRITESKTGNYLATIPLHDNTPRQSECQ